MKLTLISKTKEIGNIKTFVFKPEKKLRWIAGQYMIYSLPHGKEDLRGKQRFFTISSPPQFKYPSITTRIEKNPSSFKKYLNDLAIGGTVNAKGPDGDFIVEKKTNDLIFIAGGVGITPFRSILQDITNKKNKAKITLLYASKTENILFKDDLDQIAKGNTNLKIKYFINPAKIGGNVIEKYITKKAKFYVSGPDPMVEKIEQFLILKGVREENIRLDYFSGYDNY